MIRTEGIGVKVVEKVTPIPQLTKSPSLSPVLTTFINPMVENVQLLPGPILNIHQNQNTQMPSLAPILRTEQNQNTQMPSLAPILRTEQNQNTQMPSLAPILRTEQNQNTQMPSLAPILVTRII